MKHASKNRCPSHTHTHTRTHTHTHIYIYIYIYIYKVKALLLRTGYITGFRERKVFLNFWIISWTEENAIKESILTEYDWNLSENHCQRNNIDQRGCQSEKSNIVSLFSRHKSQLRYFLDTSENFGPKEYTYGTTVSSVFRSLCSWNYFLFP